MCIQMCIKLCMCIQICINSHTYMYHFGFNTRQIFTIRTAAAAAAARLRDGAAHLDFGKEPRPRRSTAQAFIGASDADVLRLHGGGVTGVGAGLD